MKIKLNVDLPIAPEHGAKKGRVFDVVEADRLDDLMKRYFFIGDTGERCAALSREFEIIHESDER